MNIYKVVKRILIFLPFISLWVIFDPSMYSEFGKYSWKILVLLLFLRPLRDIFKYDILKKATTLRKELWIISWVFAIAHAVGYFLDKKLPVSFLFDSIMWDPRGYLGVGMFTLVIAIILTVTSNVFSIKKMWKYWKPIQRLSYLMLFLVSFHIAMVKPDQLLTVVIIDVVYVLIYIYAYSKNKKNNNPS